MLGILGFEVKDRFRAERAYPGRTDGDPALAEWCTTGVAKRRAGSPLTPTRGMTCRRAPRHTVTWSAFLRKRGPVRSFEGDRLPTVTGSPESDQPDRNRAPRVQL